MTENETDVSGQGGETAPGVEGVLAEALAGHRLLVLNAGGRTGCRGCTWLASAPAQSERARQQHEAHVAAEQAKALRPVLADVWDEGHRDVCTDCNCRSENNPYRSAS